MLATPERVHESDWTEVVVWHKPVQPEQCHGECDFHALACSSVEGIVLPGPNQDVPLDLDRPGERWCTDCLAIINAARTTEQ
ncbi:hypothetical protein [Streptomyces sp. 7N604]|uniref:hypothetical protein n=1 Tax=Streptomyces sp. 7N604 TaxID=3457415 RepID=UPI003FD5C9FA